MRFTKLSKNALILVTESRAPMSKFTFNVSKIVVKQCRIEMLIKEMDISILMTHVQ